MSFQFKDLLKNMSSGKKWKRVVDNKMKSQGDIDFDEKLIRVNPKKAKKKSTVSGTMYHEEYHKTHPQAHEKTVYKKEKEWLKKAGTKAKRKISQKYNFARAEKKLGVVS